MKSVINVYLLVIFFGLFCYLPAEVIGGGSTQYNLWQGNIGVQGYDPVSYFAAQPEPGTSQFMVEYDGVLYRFARAESMELFQKYPERYLPEYGGWCAWAMLDGKRVSVNPKRYKIIDGRLYLYYDGFWGNTLEKWNSRARQETEKAMLHTADENWEKMLAN